MKKILSFVLFMFILPLAAEAEPVWVESVEFLFPIETYAYETATIYAEPDSAAEVVGELQKAPGDVNDTLVVQMRVLYDSEQPVWECARDVWWRISKPVEGWVEKSGLALWHSGFIGEVLEKEDFDDPQKFLPVSER